CQECNEIISVAPFTEITASSHKRGRGVARGRRHAGNSARAKSCLPSMAELGLEVPEEKDPEKARKPAPDEGIYDILAQTAQFYQQQLQQHPEAVAARQYLEQRGLSDEVIAQFGLGYAPPDWETLPKVFRKNKSALIKAGMLIERERSGHYDRFRHRIMFPIQDRRGRFIGFGGRVLDDSKPKYLNSPETEVFQKSRELYGLYAARQTRPAPNRIIVVEGYMDVIALSQHGITNAVATLGTATGKDHLTQLFRAVGEVVFCFDGDEAGRKAAWRALENALMVMQGERQISFMFLPDGEDPDTMVRSVGTDGFNQRLDRAMPLSGFFFERLTQQCRMDTLDGRARLVELAGPLIGNLPAGSYHTLMQQKLSELSQMPLNQLNQIVNKKTQPARQHKTVNAPRTVTPMRTAITLLMLHPELATRVDDIEYLKQIDTPGMDLLINLLEFTQQHPQLSTGAILEHWRETEHEQTLKKLITWAPPIPEDGIYAEFDGALQRMREQHLEKQQEALLQKARVQNLSAEEKAQLETLLKRS
ncbi:MAG: DNA primase, partial [Pseudomonadota bacterium]